MQHYSPIIHALYSGQMHTVWRNEVGRWASSTNKESTLQYNQNM